MTFRGLRPILPLPVGSSGRAALLPARLANQQHHPKDPMSAKKTDKKTEAKPDPSKMGPGQKILAREKEHAATGKFSEADKVIRGEH